VSRRVWTILRREYLQRVRNKWFLLATLLVPMLMLGATFMPMVMAERSQSRPASVAVIDQSGGELDDRIAELLAE
jgi:ABC-2 type transport system permease protein